MQGEPEKGSWQKEDKSRDSSAPERARKQEEHGWVEQPSIWYHTVTRVLVLSGPNLPTSWVPLHLSCSITEAIVFSTTIVLRPTDD